MVYFLGVLEKTVCVGERDYWTVLVVVENAALGFRFSTRRTTKRTAAAAHCARMPFAGRTNLDAIFF